MESIFKPMQLQETNLPGCYELIPQVFRDNRGTFVKTYHEDVFAGKGLRTDWREEYYSVSNRGVIRGMHFQTPPEQHTKMVYCLQGAVQDVVLDLRLGSPTFGECMAIELSADKGNIIYIPEGMAHGFCTLSDQAILQYKVTSTYSPEHDSGILWSSLPIAWHCATPTLSVRDSSFVALTNFQSPFKFDNCQDAE